MGTLALSWTEPDRARHIIRETQRLTQRPFGVNLVLEWPQHHRLEVGLELGVPVISTFWGDPAPYVDDIKAARATHFHTVGSAEEARRAVAAGVDVIVAQGMEAGGHLRGEVSTFVLVPAVVDAIAPVPVVAAGGVADGRGLLAALALGADAVWVGTRFLLAAEANTHEVYRDALARATEVDTVRTTLFDGGWPNAPHRALRNSTVASWEARGRPGAPDRPGEGEEVARGPDGRPLLRYGDDVAVRGTSGDVEALALYAGQGVGLIDGVRPARQLIEEFTAQALAQFSSA